MTGVQTCALPIFSLPASPPDSPLRPQSLCPAHHTLPAGLSRWTSLLPSSPGPGHPRVPWVGIYLHTLPKAEPTWPPSLGIRLLCCPRRFPGLPSPVLPRLPKEHRLASLRIPGTGWAALGGHNHVTQSCRWQRDPQLREVPSGRGTVRSRDREEEGRQARQEDTASERFSGGSPSWMSFQTSWGLFSPLLAG